MLPSPFLRVMSATLKVIAISCVVNNVVGASNASTEQFLSGPIRSSDAKEDAIDRDMLLQKLHAYVMTNSGVGFSLDGALKLFGSWLSLGPREIYVNTAYDQGVDLMGTKFVDTGLSINPNHADTSCSSITKGYESCILPSGCSLVKRTILKSGILSSDVAYCKGVLNEVALGAEAGVRLYNFTMDYHLRGENRHGPGVAHELQPSVYFVRVGDLAIPIPYACLYYYNTPSGFPKHTYSSDHVLLQLDIPNSACLYENLSKVYFPVNEMSKFVMVYDHIHIQEINWFNSVLTEQLTYNYPVTIPETMLASLIFKIYAAKLCRGVYTQYSYDRGFYLTSEGALRVCKIEDPSRGSTVKIALHQNDGVVLEAVKKLLSGAESVILSIVEPLLRAIITASTVIAKEFAGFVNSELFQDMTHGVIKVLFTIFGGLLGALFNIIKEIVATDERITLASIFVITLAVVYVANLAKYHLRYFLRVTS